MGRRKKQEERDAADKLKVVKEYLTGHNSFVKLGRKYQLNESSLRKWAAKYKIQAASTVLQWVKRYNNHEELTDSRPEGVYRIVKNNPARKTTLEERLSIIEYCIEQDDNYSLTAKEYNCSYAQVRSWVLKYRAEGIEGLYDRRGKKKEEELTELERLQAENRMLKAKAKKQQMEIDLLKKLKEIEGR